MDLVSNLKHRLTPGFLLIRQDLKNFPKTGKLGASLLATLCLTATAWLILPDFADLNKIRALSQMAKIAAVAFLFPALFEEIVFRGFLNAPQTKFSITFSTILFVLWHPFAGFLLIPEAMPYMIDPRFLFFVAIFGVAFCLMRKWTCSLWTPMLCHWLLVVIWKGLGGVQFITP